MQVILVRPWRSATISGGCCSAAPDSVALEDTVHTGHRTGDVFAETYRLLREQLPGVDVQMVSSENTVFLLPSSYKAARRTHGPMWALRRAVLSTTAGAVLVDGEVVGDVESLGPDAVLERVLATAVA